VHADLLAKGLLKRVSYSLCPDGASEIADSDYVHSIDYLPNESLDFCLVDGKARQWCACAAVPKMKTGGLFVLDNANWYLPTPAWSTSPCSVRLEEEIAGETWHRWLRETRYWPRQWTSNGVTDTLLLRKSSSRTGSSWCAKCQFEVQAIDFMMAEIPDKSSLDYTDQMDATPQCSEQFASGTIVAEMDFQSASFGRVADRANAASERRNLYPSGQTIFPVARA
jgi:hypothetical protein